MKVISFVSRKGGVGKSTICCALALYLAERGGLTVAVQDMEIDGGSSAFVEAVSHPGLTLYQEGEEYDAVLIDTEGNATAAEVSEVERISDVVILPLEITPLDIAKTYETIEALEHPNKARVLINKVRTNTTAWRDKDNALSALQISILTTPINRRTCYAKFLVSGWSELNKAAINELERLAWEVMK